MNRLRGLVTVLLIASLVGSGIAYHLNVVKEHDTKLEVVVTTVADVSRKNRILASENKQLESGTDLLLLSMGRAFTVCEELAQAGVTSHEEIEIILKQAETLRVEYVIAGEQVPPIIDSLIDLLKRVRDRLLDVFIEPMEVPDVPLVPKEDLITSKSFDGDNLYAGRYHTRSRTSRFFKRSTRRRTC